MTTNYSTFDALNTLCTSIPDWKSRLDELNGQIALRQIELARLEEIEKREHLRSPTAKSKSLKNKGSTESLRPKDGNESPFSQPTKEEAERANGTPSNAVASPRPPQNGFSSPPSQPPQRPSSSSAAVRALPLANTPANTPATPSKAHSNPRPSPNALTRQSSQPTPPTQPRLGPAILRKRKTDSLASGESMAPKYRTRSMIIVYYDSAVQTAFEELVKFVSGSRNAMRKGKMAAKMAEMRRAAELEVDNEDDDDDDDGEDELDCLAACKAGRLLAASSTKGAGAKEGSAARPPSPGPAADVDRGQAHTSQTAPASAPAPAPAPAQPAAAAKTDADDLPLPKLRFVSTRQMGPSRDYATGKYATIAGQLGGVLGGYRRGGLGPGGKPDIFDELDKGLEWCQSQCEHAAHQFLRDGECEKEIASIKHKLSEVGDKAGQEAARLREEEKTAPEAMGGAGLGGPPWTPLRGVNAEGKSRELKSVHMRRELVASQSLQSPTQKMMALEVDDGMRMEVDDEGVDDMDGMDMAPPMLLFKRSRDAHMPR